MYWGAYGVRLELHTPVACKTGSFRMAQIPSKDRAGVADTNTIVLTYKAAYVVCLQCVWTHFNDHRDSLWLLLSTINTTNYTKKHLSAFHVFWNWIFLESWSVNAPVSQVLWVNFVKCALNKVDVETKYRLSVGLISIWYQNQCWYYQYLDLCTSVYPAVHVQLCVCACAKLSTCVCLCSTWSPLSLDSAHREN